MQKTGLAQILAPLSVEEFFKGHWPHTHLFVPASPQKMKELLELPQLQDLEKLVAARRLKVRACLPDFEDEYSSIHLEPQEALKAYRNQMTLVFDTMQAQEPAIAETLENLRADLGLLTGGAENDLCRARSIVYATPGGCGTRLHFDANANFIVQIHGSKSWYLAPNTSVKNPTERFTAGAFEMSAALEKQCHAMLLNELPNDAIEILMQPGCVLFVPRGCWHATTTDEDSLSLNFTFGQPTWADVFTKSLQELLLTSPDWRELADGLGGTDAVRKKLALARFEVLLSQLAAELPAMSANQLLTEAGLLSIDGRIDTT